MAEFFEYFMYFTMGSTLGFWLCAIIAIKGRCNGGRRRFKDVGVQVGLNPMPHLPAAPAMPRVRLRLPTAVWLAVRRGKKYHFDERCGGLANAEDTKAFLQCDRCATTAGD